MNKNSKVIIVDLLGIYSGMHYYDHAFAELLEKNNYDVKIWSNFKIHERDENIIPNLYNKNKLHSSLILLITYFKVLIYSLKNKECAFIFQWYGRPYDIPFLLMSKVLKNFFVDVHEVHALKYGDNSFWARVIGKVFRAVINNVIYHSKRSINLLTSAKYNRNTIYVPHFKYCFNKSYSGQNISTDIIKAYKSEKIKFLFFGNLAINKGIDTVINTFLELEEKYKNRITLIIAGKNFDNVDLATLKDISENYFIFDRHINDDELVYCYKNTDYVLLPYKKSSQSGILEMATFFRKPMILSDIPYFKKVINEFPSFGTMDSLENFKKVIIDVIETQNKQYYTKEDCLKNEQAELMKKFITDFTISLC